MSALLKIGAADPLPPRQPCELAMTRLLGRDSGRDAVPLRIRRIGVSDRVAIGAFELGACQMRVYLADASVILAVFEPGVKVSRLKAPCSCEYRPRLHPHRRG